MGGFPSLGRPDCLWASLVRMRLCVFSVLSSRPWVLAFSSLLSLIKALPFQSYFLRTLLLHDGVGLQVRLAFALVGHGLHMLLWFVLSVPLFGWMVEEAIGGQISWQGIDPSYFPINYTLTYWISHLCCLFTLGKSHVHTWNWALWAETLDFPSVSLTCIHCFALSLPWRSYMNKYEQIHKLPTNRF